MKKLMSLLAILVMVLAIASCGGQAGKEKVAKAETIEVSVDSLLVDASALEGKTVKFEANVDHACMHGGKRLTVFGSVEGKTMKVEGSEITPKFESSLMGKKVEVVGIVRKVPGSKVADCETEEGNPVPEFAFTVECISIKEL